MKKLFDNKLTIKDENGNEVELIRPLQPYSDLLMNKLKDSEIVKKYYQDLDAYFEIYKKNNIENNTKPKPTGIDVNYFYLIFKDRYLLKYGVEYIDNSFIRDLINYFLNYDYLSSCETKVGNRALKIENRKGLFVFGDMGIGKSSSIIVINEIIRDNFVDVKDLNGYFYNIIAYNLPVYRYIDSKRLVEFQKNNSLEIFTGLTIIDDLMTENGKMHYGTELNPVAEIIEMREGTNKKMILISNLVNGSLEHTFEMFINIYGYRVVDRMFGQFNILKIKEKQSMR